MARGATLVRVGPVHFQPLEDELAAVAGHVRGDALNAGCGSRDLAPWMAAHGATSLTNYDLASTLDGVLIGPLETMPFADASFDTVLCNAVLEHVIDAEAVMREIARVLRPGGRAIIAVPFLQPFHECPTDFRRYTADGLAQLGERAGLTPLATLPVHGAAQTLGWIAWDIAQEKGRLTRWMAWPVVWLWTRLSHRTDPAVRRNANTYQLVFAKP